MRKILLSQDKFDSLGLLDLDTGHIEIVSKKSHPELLSKQEHGFYSKLNKRLFCLFVDNNQLFIKIDDQTIELTEDTSVLLKPVDEKRNLFEIIQDHEVVFSWKYENPVNGDLLSVQQFFNPLISEEEYDFCLFIYNIANDPERRERLINRLSN